MIIQATEHTKTQTNETIPVGVLGGTAAPSRSDDAIHARMKIATGWVWAPKKRFPYIQKTGGIQITIKMIRMFIVGEVIAELNGDGLGSWANRWIMQILRVCLQQHSQHFCARSNRIQGKTDKCVADPSPARTRQQRQGAQANIWLTFSAISSHATSPITGVSLSSNVRTSSGSPSASSSRVRSGPGSFTQLRQPP